MDAVAVVLTLPRTVGVALKGTTPVAPRPPGRVSVVRPFGRKGTGTVGEVITQTVLGAIATRDVVGPGGARRSTSFAVSPVCTLARVVVGLAFSVSLRGAGSPTTAANLDAATAVVAETVMVEGAATCRSPGAGKAGVASAAMERKVALTTRTRTAAAAVVAASKRAAPAG